MAHRIPIDNRPRSGLKSTAWIASNGGRVFLLEDLATQGVKARFVLNQAQGRIEYIGCRGGKNRTTVSDLQKGYQVNSRFRGLSSLTISPSLTVVVAVRLRTPEPRSPISWEVQKTEGIPPSTYSGALYSNRYQFTMSFSSLSRYPRPACYLPRAEK